MSAWPIVKLSEVCKFDRGLTYTKGDEVESDGTPVLRANNIDLATGRLDLSDVRYVSTNVAVPEAKRTRKGALLICTASGSKSHLGKVAYIDDAVGWAFGGFMGQITAKPSIDSRYLYYLLVSDFFRNHLGKRSEGININNLKFSDIADFEIPLPPLTEQKRIVAILDEAFEGIAKATTNAERNLANARELPDALLDTVLADRDGKWVETTLGVIADFKNGLNFTKTSKGETIRIVGVKDFQNDYWVPEEGLDTVTIDGSLPPAYELKSGDILTVRSNGNKKLIGRCMIAAGVAEKTSHSGFTIRIRVTDHRVMPEFLAHVLKSRRARAELVASGGGANISSLNQQALTDLPIAFPSMADQERILARIESLMNGATQLAEACRLKLGSFAALKQALLHKAFSGQLTGKEAIAA